MKAILFCWIFLAIVIPGRPEVVIRGHIKDSSHAKVTILEPIDSCCNRSIARPDFVARVGADGFFEKRVKVDFPVMVTITVGIRPIWIFVEPGDTVTVDVDISQFGRSSPGNGIHIKGRNGVGSTFYNSFNYAPKLKFDVFEHLLDSLNFRNTLDLGSVDYALSEIIRPFDSLLAGGKITKTFYNIVVSDTRNVLLSHLIRFVFLEKSLLPGQALDFFDRLYARYPLTDPVIRGGLYGMSPCAYYYFIKARKTYPNEGLADSILVVHGKKVFVNKNLVPYLYAPSDLREFLWGFELITLNRLFAESFGKRDVETFMTIFPDSKMHPYFAPPYFNLAAGPASFGDSSAFVFEPADRITSFDSLLYRFRGKRLFVDLWATWCVPCKMEFASNAPADSFCIHHGIERLYIAFERGPTRNSVRKDVFAYNLKGIHVIANDTLIKDMTERIYWPNEGYTIPHYLLINEKGKIVDKDAPRPSSPIELFSRMRTVFKIAN
jgi:thiol-disulfide isomerase/thioredoxin